MAERKGKKDGPAEGDAPGVPARRAALSLLDAVLRKGLPLDSAMPSATRDIERADDRALALAIASEVLRRLPDLDDLIDSATQKPLPDDAKARTVLRIALIQALVMDVAPHAAIATALPLVESGPRRLVHGVFGALMRREMSLPALPRLPDRVALRWDAAWGADVLEAASALLAVPPPLDLAFAPGSEPAVEGVSLLPGHLRLPRGTRIADLPGYEDGGWWVQDVAASLPGRLLGAGNGRRALDLCAAPGGKTMQLAAAGWEVTAIDIAEKRMERVRENLARTKLSAQLVTADINKWAPDAPADAVLLDAPCSATGTYRRHPDVLHRVRPKAVGEMAEVQARLLARAADGVVPGGTLLYAVCSLEPQEGEEVVKAFLEARADYRLSPPDDLDLPGVETKGGMLRILPGLFADQGGADGFFIARMVRNGG